MDKVKQVTFLNEDWLKFNYDGSGGLILRENSKGNTWKYIGNSLYLNDTLYQIKYSEGRISLDTNQNFVYEFEYRDHLGNFRLSYKDPTIGTPSERMAPEIVQSNESDPWGWDIKALKFSPENSQNFIFQKQEFHDETNWINFKYRPYDPSIAKFIQIDRLSQKYAFMSPYQFSSNNPVVNVEIDGLEGLYYLRAASSQSVTSNAKKTNESAKKIFTPSLGVGIGKIGGEVKMGPVQLSGQASILETNVNKNNGKTTVEIKGGNAEVSASASKVTVGGSVNFVKTEFTDSGSKTSTGDANFTGGNDNLSTDGKDVSAGIKLNFGVVSAGLSASISQIQETIKYSIETVGAFFSEILGSSTNGDLGNKNNKNGKN